ncbi:MAG: transposase family protein [Streptomycetales bacterium]
MEFAKTTQLQTGPHPQMSCSSIECLTDTLIVDGPPSAGLTDSERCGLLDRLAEVPDPRDPRGVRYPLASLVTVAVCAVLSGAVTFAAIADWLDDLPETDLHQVGLTGGKPVATTMWRLLVRVDSVALTSVLAAWLLARNRVQRPATSRRIIAVDGKTVRGTLASDGRCVHLLAASPPGSPWPKSHWRPREARSPRSSPWSTRSRPCWATSRGPCSWPTPCTPRPSTPTI